MFENYIKNNDFNLLINGFFIWNKLKNIWNQFKKIDFNGIIINKTLKWDENKFFYMIYFWPNKINSNEINSNFDEFHNNINIIKIIIINEIKWNHF